MRPLWLSAGAVRLLSLESRDARAVVQETARQVPAARTRASAPRLPTSCTRGRETVFGRPGRGARGQASRAVEGLRVGDQPLSQREVADSGGRRDECHRRRQQQVEPVEELEAAVSRTRAALARRAAASASVTARQRSIFGRDLLAVQLGVLGIELAVHVCDLVHEEGADVSAAASSSARLRGNRAAAAATRSRDERVGVLEPGDADRDLLERARPPRLVNPGASASRSAAHVGRRVRAIGPTWSKLGASGKQPSVGTRSKVGLKPTTPQHAAGMRIDPPESVPSAASARPAASAAPSRRVEPPASRPGASGIRDGAEVRVLGRDPVGELVQVRLADVRIAGRLGKEDGCRARAPGRARRRSTEPYVVVRPCSVEQVLDGEPVPCRQRRGSQGRCRRPPSADPTGYLRRFGFGGFFTGAIATRRVALAP